MGCSETADGEEECGHDGAADEIDRSAADHINAGKDDEWAKHCHRKTYNRVNKGIQSVETLYEERSVLGDKGLASQLIEETCHDSNHCSSLDDRLAFEDGGTGFQPGLAYSIGSLEKVDPATFGFVIPLDGHLKESGFLLGVVSSFGTIQLL